MFVSIFKAHKSEASDELRKVKGNAACNRPAQISFQYGYYSYVLQIFKMQANTVASWGFNQPVRVSDGNGMEFSVEGFIHQGKVKVLYNAVTDAFDIYILNADGSTKVAIEEAYIDVLVDVIDRHVERCENYEQRVKEFYHL